MVDGFLVRRKQIKSNVDVGSLDDQDEMSIFLIPWGLRSILAPVRLLDEQPRTISGLFKQLKPGINAQNESR